MQQNQAINGRLAAALQWAHDEQWGRRPYVYVMADGGETVKIGISIYLAQRLNTMRGHSGRRLVIAYAYECASKANARRIESAAQRLLDKHRVFREWFAVSASDAQRAVEQAAATHPG